MKVEGIEIEWWEKEKFRNRKIEIFCHPNEKVTIDVPDDDVLCDSCNSLIIDFPVAVWDGMAYCKVCFEKYLKPNTKE